MSGTSPETAAWSGRQWGAVLFAVFSLHLVALFLVSSRQEKVQRHAGSHASVRWLTDPAGARKALDVLLLTDPTQFAMVQSRGFSGAAWMRLQSPEYRPAEWTEAERSLPQPTQLLGGAFSQISTVGERSALALARKPSVETPALAVPQAPLRSRSQVLVEGDVRLRPLVKSPLLKSWPHSDVLADTRVQVLVTADGLVFSPRLAGTANVKNPAQRAADLHALELARQLRFEPAAKNNPASVEGVIVFQWHTIAPPAPAKP